MINKMFSHAALRLAVFIFFTLSLTVHTQAGTRSDPPPSGKDSSSFYFPKFRPEIFYDNKVLPEDVEVEVFVFKAQTQRVFFLLEGNRRPLAVTVTPCSAAVEWRLSFQTFPDAPNVGTKDPWRNHVLQLQPVNTLPVTTSYYGKERRTYATLRASAGLYTMELDSSTQDVAVRVQVSTRPPSQPSFPALPADARVEVMKVRRNRALVTWKPISAESDAIEYCVVANLRENYLSFCAVTSDLYGDVPTTPPTSSGFGFWWEKSSRHSMAARVTDLRRRTEKKTDVLLKCVGRKTWHMFRGLQRGTQYFFDVFAVNTRTNASSAYSGTSATTKNTSAPARLKDNTTVDLSLDSSNGFASVLKFHLSSAAEGVWFFVQSCMGPGPIMFTVSKGGQELLREEVTDMKTFVLSNPANGTYTLLAKSDLRKPKKGRLWVSRKYHAFPFATLPTDRSVKVFDTLSTCDSVTLGWQASVDEKVKYCIYRRTAVAGLMRVFAKPQDFCEEKAESSKGGRERVLCRRYHRFSKRRFNNVIMQRVRDLLPGTTYLFEVQVTKSRGKTLAYEQVWVTTRKSCSVNR